MRWLLQVLIALDQLANALLGGWADETLSAHAHRAGWGWRRRAINAVFFWQSDHCRSSYEAEMERRQMAPEYRDNVRSNR
jgi:hypothetical protein